MMMVEDEEIFDCDIREHDRERGREQ